VDVEFEQVEEGVVYEFDCAIEFCGGVLVRVEVVGSWGFGTSFHAEVELQRLTCFVAGGERNIL
jgi:hypothetical protein